MYIVCPVLWMQLRFCVCPTLPHVADSGWTHTLLDGFAGGFLGAVGAFLAALWVVKSQSRADRQLAKDQLRYGAAAAVMQGAADLTSKATGFFEFVNDIQANDNKSNLQVAVQQTQVFAMGLGGNASIAGSDTLAAHTKLQESLQRIIDTLIGDNGTLKGAQCFMLVLNVLHTVNELHNAASTVLVEAL